MLRKQTVQCDLCGAKAFLIHHGTRDNPDISVYECEKCHTKLLGDMEERDYEHGFMNGKAEMSPEEIAQRLDTCRQDDQRRVSTLSEWCQDKDVLDFGCGFGGFLEGISHVARTVAGVELGASERRYLCGRGVEVKKDIAGYQRRFDVITLFHVFEHLQNPQRWLAIFANSLRGRGRLFLEVPNANDALLALYQNTAFADFTYWSAHLHLYTHESLRRLIEESGAYIIESAGQVQRYPLSNHLYWLAQGKPGGQAQWTLFNSETLSKAYEQALAGQKLCDTLFFRLVRK